MSRGALSWSTGLFLILLCGACVLTPPGDGPGSSGRRGPPAGLVKREPEPSTIGGERLRFEWEDPNTVRYEDRRGDTFVAASREAPDRYAVIFHLDPLRLRERVESFGVPEDWIGFRYTTAEEFEERLGELRARFSEHGIAVTAAEKGLNVAADPQWIVSVSRRDVVPLAGDLRDLAVERRRSDWREFLGLGASFVQGIRYKIPPDSRPGPEGERIVTCGVALPLEVLAGGWGDCDSKCFLLASILTNVEGAGVILLQGENHMFLGVACPPRPLDRYVTVQGIDYVLVEVTHPWPLGAIPRSIEDGLQANRYEVIPVGR